MKYIPRREVLKVLNIHYQTLYKMVERKEIDVIDVGSKKLYNLEKYLKDHNVKKEGKKICYCRVSSAKQKEDLERQVKYMKEKYPEYEIIKDIGSGLNMKRKGLKEIMKRAIEGEVEEVVIAYKDRLARFGYELIEWTIEEYSKGKITIINKKEEETPHEEIAKDILQIMNVYVAKINGLRKYKTKMQDEIDKDEIDKDEIDKDKYVVGKNVVGKNVVRKIKEI